MEESISTLDEVKGEISLIKSAYDNELEEFKEYEHNELEKLYHFKLKLGPHHSVGGTLYNHFSATLNILIFNNYPQRSAEVEIASSTGLTENEKIVLQGKLDKIASSNALQNFVTVLDLCNYTGRYLSDAAAEKEANLQKIKLETEGRRLKQLQDEEKERNLFLQKSKMVDLAIKNERKQRREHSPTTDKVRSLSSSSNKDTTWCCVELDAKENFCHPVLPFTVELSNSSISLLQQISKNEYHMQKYIGINYNAKKNILVSKWAFHNRTDKQCIQKIEKLLTKINGFENMKKILHSIKHENLAPFSGLDMAYEEGKCINLYLHYEHPSLYLPLNYYMNINNPANDCLLYDFTKGILNAMVYLHERDLCHGDLTENCIFFSQTNDILVTDYCMSHRSNEAITQYYNVSMKPSYPSSHLGKGGKKGDIHRLALILYSLRVGRKVEQAEDEIISSPNTKFMRFIKSCLKSAEKYGPSAKDLLNHEFIQQYMPEKETKVEKGKAKEKHMNKTDFSPLIESNDVQETKDHSRLHKDFENLHLLGKGGFGSVYKVRNLLDGNIYALKKISLHSQSTAHRTKVGREVQLLSSLNHENVVRYYTSWVDVYSINENGKNVDSDEETDTVSKDDIKKPVIEEVINENDSDDYEENNDTAVDDDTAVDWLMQSMGDLTFGNDSFNKSPSVDITFESNSENKTENVESQIETSSAVKAKCVTPQRPLTKSYLMILMEFCEKNTLRKAIDDNSLGNDTRNWRYIRETLSGLDYIHSKGLIHRDLKPGNIFLDSSNHIKIGDFGLATVAFESTPNESDESEYNPSMTGKVGTRLYIAPEVNQIKKKGSYSSKVDMFSFGIILFEMSYTFSTGSERIFVLENLKCTPPKYPCDYEESVDENRRELIKKLIHPNPTKRPSCEEVLKSPLLPPLPAEQQKFLSMIEEAVNKEGSSNFNEMIDLIFSKSCSTDIEATFDANSRLKLTPEQLQRNHRVAMIVEEIFKRHGALQLKTSFYTPKDALYKNKEYLPHFMSINGDMMTSQYELHYPLARLLANSDIKKLKRYNIDRVLRTMKTAKIHPIEIYECAYDIFDSDANSIESLVHVLMVTQDTIMTIIGVPSTDIIVKLGHLDLLKIILSQCNISGKNMSKVINMVTRFSKMVLDENEVVQRISESIEGQCDVELLREALSLSGSSQNVLNSIKSKNLLPKSQEDRAKVKDIFKKFSDIESVSKIMGLQLELILQPMICADPLIYEKLYFQVQTMNKRKIYTMYAQGGNFEQLLAAHRKKTYSTARRTDDNVCLFGVSLSLDTLVKNCDHIFLMDNFKKFGNDLPASDARVILCSVEKPQLERRVEMASYLRKLGISTDHYFLKTLEESKNLIIDEAETSRYLFIHPCGKKYDLQTVERRPTQMVMHNYFTTVQDVYEYLSKGSRLNSDDHSNTITSHRRDNSRVNTSVSSNEEIYLEFITKRNYKDKEKIQIKAEELVRNYMTNRFGPNWPSGTLDVITVDCERKFVLSLGELDLDSNFKNFSDSITELKSRESEAAKDCIDRITKFLDKKIFHSKKNEKSLSIFVYSITSEFLRRIY